MLGYLLLTWILFSMFYIPNLLLRNQLLEIDSYRKVLDTFNIVSAVFGVVGWILMLAFVISLKAVDLPTESVAGGRGPVTIANVLLSYRGRISRSEYWLKGYLILLPIGILANILMYAIDSSGAKAVGIVFGLAGMYPGCAIAVKRWHDRNRSAWWFMTLLIPFVNIAAAIWVLVEIWFLKGTDGANRFGPDPLQSHLEAEPATAEAGSPAGT